MIGAHPHVLQPIRRVGTRKVVAHSLGNFVWAAGSAAASRTGICVCGCPRAGWRERGCAQRGSPEPAHAHVDVRPPGTLCRMRVRRSLLLAGLIAVAVGGCGGGSKDAARPLSSTTADADLIDPGTAPIDKSLRPASSTLPRVRAAGPSPGRVTLGQGIRSGLAFDQESGRVLWSRTRSASSRSRA